MEATKQELADIQLAFDMVSVARNHIHDDIMEPNRREAWTSLNKAAYYVAYAKVVLENGEIK